MPRIAIIGLGVVGRTLADILVRKVKGAAVVGYDSAESANSCKAKRARTLQEALKGASHVFLCVPSHLQGQGVDGPGWIRLAGEIRKFADKGAILVVKSTLVPGDADKLQKLSGLAVVVCPEFMSEGTAEQDILHPHRVLVGGSDRPAVDSVIRIYRQWVPARKIVRMDAWSAQLAKLLANAMLAQRVSSINSLTALCEKSGGDVRAVAHAVGRDPRIGGEFLNASPGFGGSCFEKDLRLLVTLAKCLGHQEVARYWQSVIQLNDNHIHRVTRAISKAAGHGGKVAIFGLGFKGGVDDVRNSPSLRILDGLVAAGHPVVAYDPQVLRTKGVKIRRSPAAAAVRAKVIAVLTNDRLFRRLDWSVLSRRGLKVYDAHGIIADKLPTTGRLISMGRGDR